MNIITLTAFLSPFLPFLIQMEQKTANQASKAASEQFGDAAWQKSQTIWRKLHLVVDTKEAAKEAVADVAHDPEDEDARAALRIQLKKLLEQHQGLAEAIAQIMQADTPDGTAATKISQTVMGSQNQVIGQISGGQVFGNVTGTVAIGASHNSRPQSGVSPDLASTTSEPKTILILAANPTGTSPLRLDQEVKELQAGLERASQRDRFRLQQRWAVSARDVRRALLDCKPSVVHFSGHGDGEAGLVLQTEAGQIQLIKAEALSQLFALFADQIECIVLNACYSEVQANAIVRHIPYVIGMKQAIGDKAAIEFAIGFYDALLAGKSIEFAYKLGCNAIKMAGILEQLTPVLKRK